MKVLLVEDDVKIATAIQRGLDAEGFAVEVAFDGDDGLWRATEGVVRPHVLDLMLPGRNGFQICADAARGGRLDADPRAHRQGRRARRGRGARHRCRRLPHQAVLVPGADRAGAGAAAPHRRARSGAGRGRRPADRSRRPARLAWRRRDRPHRPRVRRARVPPAPRRAGAAARPRSSPACGTTTSTATPTSSRSTSGACAARSTSPSATHTIETVRGAGYRMVDDG